MAEARGRALLGRPQAARSVPAELPVWLALRPRAEPRAWRVLPLQVAHPRRVVLRARAALRGAQVRQERAALVAAAAARRVAAAALVEVAR